MSLRILLWNLDSNPLESMNRKLTDRLLGPPGKVLVCNVGVLPRTLEKTKYEARVEVAWKMRE